VTKYRPVRPGDFGWLDQVSRGKRRPLDLHVGRKPLRNPPVTGNRERACTAALAPKVPFRPVQKGRASCVRRAGVLTPTVARLSTVCQARTLKRATAVGAPPTAKARRVPRLKAHHSDAVS
jgi:hypothetical protein